jgi:dTMP kinase
MPLIVISGIDGSGKYTQSKLLSSYLVKNGVHATQVSFPIYGSASGELISQYLSGDYGKPSLINPKLASILYMFNRYEFKGLIQAYLSQGMTVVCDRYVESNLAHQGHKITNKIDRIKFYQWCQHVEFELFGLPKPDKTIILHVPHIISKSLMGSRPCKDLHETDTGHQSKAEEIYLELAELYGWIVIDCTENGAMRAAESILNSIISSI